MDTPRVTYSVFDMVDKPITDIISGWIYPRYDVIRTLFPDRYIDITQVNFRLLQGR